MPNKSTATAGSKKSSAHLSKEINGFVSKMAHLEDRFLKKPSLIEDDKWEDELKPLEEEIKAIQDSDEDSLTKDQEDVTDYLLKKIGILSG